ncbi:hypothetical protein Bbelb_035050 [Branchiostoma belcheri]|nr:hypothetical protein Bbelb_447150 [Branchiostoma belcheri]KAI8517488.1 hypothetical protein Bbelb_035050 [Branchiostoma belcheri]
MWEIGRGDWGLIQNSSRRKASKSEDRGVSDIMCIVDHVNFNLCILNQDTLRMRMTKIMKKGIENKNYRWEAYTNFSCTVDLGKTSAGSFHLKIFADDSKLYGNVKQTSSIEALQGDLNEVDNWSKLWQLQFNVGKCKVMHLGGSNRKAEYTLGGQKIMETEEEKDLGVIVDSKLTFHSQSARAANKGNQLLGLIKRSFYNLDEHTIPILYKTMVRPHLEYGNVIWGPHSSIRQQEHLRDVNGQVLRLIRATPDIANTAAEKCESFPGNWNRTSGSGVRSCFSAEHAATRPRPQNFSSERKQDGQALACRCPLRIDTATRCQINGQPPIHHDEERCERVGGVDC